jgi:beta-glucosidase
MAGSVIEAEESAADVRAREIEKQMTDDERFLLVIGVMGQIASFTPVRDERICCADTYH